jgi:hypothetical protein
MLLGNYMAKFLDSGAQLINGGYITDDACPFCLSDYDLGQLKSEVDQRFRAMEYLKEKIETPSIGVKGLINVRIVRDKDILRQLACEVQQV